MNILTTSLRRVSLVLQSQYDDIVARHWSLVNDRLYLIAFILVAAFSVSCASSQRGMPKVEGYPAPSSNTVRLLACLPALEVFRDAVTVVDETGSYLLQVPSSLQRAPRGRYFFVHGGDVWEDAQTKVSIAFGHWAEYSFQEEAGERCRVMIGDTNVFVIVKPNMVIAWYDRQSGGHEPVVMASSHTQSIGTLAAVALSLGRVKPSRSEPWQNAPDRLQCTSKMELKKCLRNRSANASPATLERLITGSRTCEACQLPFTSGTPM